MARTEIIEQSDQLLLNIFPINLPKNTIFEYRIWCIDDPPSEPKTREKIRRDLWKSKLKRPVYSTYHEGRFAFEVANWGKQEEVTYTGGGNHKYTIKPTAIVKSIQPSSLTSDTGDMVASMLQQQFSQDLRNSRELTVSHQNFHFFQRATSDPLRDPRDNRTYPKFSTVDIYRGFSFRVIYLDNSGLCLVLDVSTSYVGKRTLSDYLNSGGLPQGVDTLGGYSRWIVDLIRSRSSVYLHRHTDIPISSAQAKNSSVYKYLVSTYPWIKNNIAPSDKTAYVIYRLDDANDNENHYAHSSSLLKPKFSVGSHEVRQTGDKPAFPPDIRLQNIEHMTKHFSKTRFAHELVQLGEPLEIELRTFALPSLEFGKPSFEGNEDVEDLHCLYYQSGKSSKNQRREWGKRKLEYLESFGAMISRNIYKAYFVFPLSIKRNNTLTKFKELTTQYCKQYVNMDVDFILDPYADDLHVVQIIQKLEGLKKNGADIVLFALPQNTNDTDIIYSAVKSIHDLPVKCFSTSKMLSESHKGRIYDYTRLNTLSMLVEAGYRFWGLKDELAYEMQIGIDVAFMTEKSLMGCSTSMLRNGTDIVFDYKPIPLKKNRIRREGIPAGLLGKYILDQLESFYQKYNRAPQNILFQRDGRLFSEEERAIRKAISKFLESHSECISPNWVIVAIQKHTASNIRFFRLSRGNALRPWSGTYFIESDVIGHLVTAGEPGIRQGTPKPLQIGIVARDDTDTKHNIVEILSDLFKLSQLNWTSPEREIALPLTLRFTDNKLERHVAEIDTEMLEEDDWSDEED